MSVACPIYAQHRTLPEPVGTSLLGQQLTSRSAGPCLLGVKASRTWPRRTLYGCYRKADLPNRLGDSRIVRGQAPRVPCDVRAGARACRSCLGYLGGSALASSILPAAALSALV